MADDALTASALGAAHQMVGPLAAANAEADRAIEQYLHDLRRELRREPDVEDVMDELADHLHAAVARHESGGASHGVAVTRALASFGRSADVGEGFRDRSQGTVGHPSGGTRVAGMAMRVAAVALPLSLGAFMLGDALESSRGDDGWSANWYSIGSVLVLIGNALGAWGAVALLTRHGVAASLKGRLATVVVVLAALTSIVAWALAFWTATLAIAWLAVLAVIGSRSVLDGTTGRLLQFGYVVAFIGVMAGAILAGGDDGTSGFDWQALGGTPGLLVMATGFLRAGSTLVNEMSSEGLPPTAAA